MATANVTDLIGISAEMMDRYERDYLRTVSDPPAGLLAYVVGESDGKMRVVEVWESDESREAFYADRVRPATDAWLTDGLPELDDQVVVPLTVRAFFSAGPAATESAS